MENLQIDFEIDGDVKGLRAKLRKVSGDLTATQKLLAADTAKLVKQAEKYPEAFNKSLSTAKDLDKYLTKISKQKGPYTLDQQNRVTAGFNQYSALQKSEAKAIINAEKTAAKEIENAQKAAAKAAADHHTNLVKARYALYDVSAEARRMGLVMAGIGVATVKVAADFERAFVDVARTTDLTGNELEAMRQSLLDISQTTPIAFAEVAKIATLGAQMNVANQDLANFSETVAKFGAVTGVSVDESATAFGRLDQMFSGVQGNYEGLASSILYAGRNAIATEAEIATLTTQVAASAAQAGYSAEQTIGLATALASLRVKPEEARGVILRLFGDFDRMVSESGQRLKDYATLMGITSTEASNLWKTDAPAFFEKFTAAITASSGSAEDLNSKLSGLGITETREVRVLQSLAGNHDVLVKSMRDATGAYADGTDLAGQYGQVTVTLTERINKLVNNIMAFASEAGDLWAKLLGPIVDLLSGILDVVASNPVLSSIASLGVAVIGLAGIFLLYQASLYQATAGVLALRTTMAELVKINGTASVSLGTLITLIRGSGAAAGDAALSTSLYSSAVNGMTGAAARAKGALIALGTVMRQNAVLIAASVAAWLIYESIGSKIEEYQNDISDAISKTTKNLSIQAKEVAGLKAEAQTDLYGNIIGQLSDLEVALKSAKSVSFGGDWGPLGLTEVSKANPTISALDENLAALVESGNATRAAELFAEISVQAQAQGIELEKLPNIFDNYTNAVKNTPPELASLSDAQLSAAASGEELSGVIKDRLTGSLTTSQNAYADYADAVKTFMTDLDASGGSINAWSDTGSQALSSFSGLLDAIIQQSGNDMKGALTQTAAALMLIESEGGDASSQVQGLVERINSLYGLNIDPTTITSMTELQSVIASTGGIAASTRAEIATLVSGGDYGDVYAEIFAEIQNSVSDGGDAVKAEVTSIFDYVSELSGLFGDITDQTFRLTEAQDGYSNGWDDTKDAVKRTKKEVANLKLEVLNLKSSGKDLENQLSIARAYGDADQIARIQAEIAANNQKIAESEREITAAQEERSMSLKGGSQAARENRAEIRARVEDAADLVAAYASTAKANGKLPTAAEVQSYANTIATQFRTQATAIGFSSTELEQYLDTIRGFGSAAGNVEAPTIDVTLNPIDTAVKAYLEKKKSTNVTIQPKDDGLAARIQAIIDRAKLKATITGSIMVDPASLKKQRDAFPKTSPMWSYFNGLYTEAYKTLQSAYSTHSMNEFASGGYVSGPGTGTSDSIPSMLSNGEYVIKASSVDKYGVDFLNSINQQRGIPVARPAATSSAGSSAPQVVYLSVQDRELLQSALNRPVSLYTTDRVIAQSANNGNKELARRGATS